jgi:hypothetical protein
MCVCVSVCVCVCVNVCVSAMYMFFMCLLHLADFIQIARLWGTKVCACGAKHTVCLVVQTSASVVYKTTLTS